MTLTRYERAELRSLLHKVLEECVLEHKAECESLPGEELFCVSNITQRYMDRLGKVLKL